jgi:NADPH2:quinone reductase
MKAILAREFGGPEVLKLEDVPDLVPQTGQIVVRVRAAGVNPYDTYMRSGNYAIRPALPYTPGADAAGIVEEVRGDAADWQPGDRVYVTGTATHKSYGAYAERIVCDPRQLHRLPDHVSFAQGAAVGVPYATAWRALHGRARIQPGETVFVHGASGSVGLAAVQLAIAWGATAIGTAGTPEGLALVRAQGASHALNHRQPGYLEELRVLTGGRGPDVIVENLANVNLDEDLGVLALNGRVVIVGNRGRIEIDPRRIMSKDSTVSGASYWNMRDDERERIYAALDAGLANRTLAPVIAAELPLAQAARAHEVVLEPGAKGKIVLIP